jgi:hypothetical protein
MNWQAWPQRFGSAVRDRPQSVHSARGNAAASAGVQGAHGGGEAVFGVPMQLPRIACQTVKHAARDVTRRAFLPS